MGSNSQHQLGIIRLENVTMVDLYQTRRVRIERKSQCVVTDHTNRSKSNICRETILMKISEEHITIHTITLEKFKGFIDLGKTPYNLSLLKRASSMHLHIASRNEIIEKFKGFKILNRIPVIGNNIQNVIIRHTNKRRMTNIHTFTTYRGKSRNLVYFPIKSSSFHHLNCGQIIRNLGSQSMPRGFPHICH